MRYRNLYPDTLPARESMRDPHRGKGCRPRYVAREERRAAAGVAR